MNTFADDVELSQDMHEVVSWAKKWQVEFSQKLEFHPDHALFCFGEIQIQIGDLFEEFHCFVCKGDPELPVTFSCNFLLFFHSDLSSVF